MSKSKATIDLTVAGETRTVRIMDIREEVSYTECAFMGYPPLRPGKFYKTYATLIPAFQGAPDTVEDSKGRTWLPVYRGCAAGFYCKPVVIACWRMPVQKED